MSRERIDEKTFILDFNKTDFERLINGERQYLILSIKNIKNCYWILVLRNT